MLHHKVRRQYVFHRNLDLCIYMQILNSYRQEATFCEHQQFSYLHDELLFDLFTSESIP